MRVRVRVWKNAHDYEMWVSTWGSGWAVLRSWPLIDYLMDYDDAEQRRRLGESCRDAFEAGQVVLTVPVD